MMKRVTTILATVLLVSSLLTAAEARGGGDGGDFRGGGHMAGFDGGAHIGGIGDGGPTGGFRVGVHLVGVAGGGMKGFGGNHIGRGEHDLDFHHQAMRHFGRFSPGYGVYDSYDPDCHKEATRGDEFPCFHE
jgi:hypothetical protein